MDQPPRSPIGRRHPWPTRSPAGARRLARPDAVRAPTAWLFDLDSVSTDTAAVQPRPRSRPDPLLAGPLGVLASGADPDPRRCLDAVGDHQRRDLAGQVLLGVPTSSGRSRPGRSG